MAEVLRVILNDRPLHATLTGVGVYTQQILTGLPLVEPAIRMSPFVAGRVRRSETVLVGGASPRSGSARRSRKPLWLRTLLDAGQAEYFRRCLARRPRFDLYHEPNHIPLPCDLPTIVTVHDLSVLEHPEWHPAERVRLFERSFERGLRRAQRLIAVSDFTKRRLIECLGVSAARIDVTWQAARPGFYPRTADEILALRVRHQLPESFFLFVGTSEPRKNVATLTAAHAALPAAVQRAHPLVIVGPEGWGAPPALADGRADVAPVRRLGYVDDDTLAGLYSACTALVWPSLYEGFGFPPLEAMACGASVIASNVTALPEVVGTGGVLLDPCEATVWTEAMRRMAEDAEWRATWKQRGRARAREFTWARCWHATAACYRTALAESGKT